MKNCPCKLKKISDVEYNEVIQLRKLSDVVA